MLGLPKSTLLNKQLPKKLIYEKFNMKTAEKDVFDKDISKIFISAEISPATTNFADGENIHSVFVLHVLLKSRNFSEKTLSRITKLIPQNVIMLLEYDSRYKLAVYYNKFMQSEKWQSAEDIPLPLAGLDMDAVWDNIIKSFAQNDDISQWDSGLSLDENMAILRQKQKLLKEIEQLEKKAKAEKQPKKKFELVQRIKKLREKIQNE